jgi:nucleoid-associated protein YgaU
LSDIIPGTYTLRIDELSLKGDVISRLESPFKREDRERLANLIAPSTSPVRINIVTVQPGNTLWAIARKRYGDGLLYVQVFEANRDKIKNPDLIYPGQLFDLPDIY